MSTPAASSSDLAGSAQAAAATARVAARGVFFIATAKLYFLGAGYAIQFGLAHLLSKEMYGAYGTVMSVLNVLNMMVLQGTLQAVSKIVSEREAGATAVKRAAIRVQAALASGIAVLYALLAPSIARLQNADAFTNAFRLSAGVVLAYGFYAIFVGSLNGRKRFKAQAGLDMTFATMRAGSVLGAAALGLGVFGAIGGFVGAAVAIVGVAIFVEGKPHVGAHGEPNAIHAAPSPQSDTQRATAKTLFQFMLPVMLYTLVLYALMNVDLWLLRAFSEATPEETDRIAGLYYGAQNLARIPYQAILAVTFVVFPLVSRATFENDIETARGYIRVTFRYSVIFLGGLVAVLAANANDLLAIPYPKAYQEAARSLAPLAAGMLFFSLFNIANAILIGAGNLRAAVVSGVVALAAAVVASFVLREIVGFDGQVAAIGAGIGFIAGCAVAGYSLFRRFGAPLSWLAAVRVLVAMGVVVVISLLRPAGGRVVTIAMALLLVGVYGLCIWAMREWGPEDTARFRRAFKRGGKVAAE